jgi:hypothetical protein
MPSLGKIGLGIGVVAAAFWITLLLLKDDDDGNTAARIEVIEATYGLNCKDHEVKPPNENKVSVGNVTKAVKSVCDDKQKQCWFNIDIDEFGDPANGCAKNFSVSWKCEGSAKIHEAGAAPPAENKSVLLSCP